ncbi:hypothetical protein HGA64_00305 [Candidatus Falkowbacteria bacterium]|nr:hypothetical protein [Candidatus Falkowbacteria bacterium]
MQKAKLSIIFLSIAVMLMVALFAVFALVRSSKASRIANVKKAEKEFYVNIATSSNVITIMDDRTDLNGFAIVRKTASTTLIDNQLGNMRIKVLPCDRLSVPIAKRYKIESDCINFDPGVNDKIEGVEYYLKYPKKFSYAGYRGLLWVNYDEGEDILPPGLWMPASQEDGYSFVRNYFFVTTEKSIY